MEAQRRRQELLTLRNLVKTADFRGLERAAPAGGRGTYRQGQWTDSGGERELLAGQIGKLGLGLGNRRLGGLGTESELLGADEGDVV